MYSGTHKVFIKKPEPGVKISSIFSLPRDYGDGGEDFMDASQRLFIAIELTPAVREWLGKARSVLSARIPSSSVRWVETGSIHLTLKFLGEIPSGRIEGIRAVLDALARSTRPFPLSLHGLGCFPNTARPRVVWAGIRCGPLLGTLQNNLEQGLEGIGFPAERRPFSPHLTLGRVREGVAGARLAEIGRAVETGFQETTAGMDAKDVCLFRSMLRPGGAEYSILYRSQFSG
jgi:2'-5' RNA ligase